MQTAAQPPVVRTKRITPRYIWIASVALAVVMLGAGIASQTIGTRSDTGSRPGPLTAGGDLTTLALDRDGADLFTPQNRLAPDTTGLALDRDGADIVVGATMSAPDTTDLLLDRDGADVVSTPANVAPDSTHLHLDRDGADIP